MATLTEIDPEDELVIREALATSIAEIMQVERSIPAPLYSSAKSDYWATDEGVSYLERYDLETNNVNFAAVYLRDFSDDPDPNTSPAHSPLVTLNYEIYWFVEYDFERADENETPDAFNKKMLRRHNDFIAGILALKAKFQGYRNIAGLPANKFATAQTWPLTVVEQIQNRIECEFIPDVRGHSIRFGEGVRLQLIAC